MVRLLYYGLSQEILGYCSKSSQKKKLKSLANSLKTFAANHQLPSFSAIQIGQSIQYFVMLNRPHLKPDQWDSYSRAKPAHYKGILNAELIDQSTEKTKQWQRCSSYPGIKMLIERPTAIKFSFMDEELKQYTEEMHDFQARVAQHQIDHYVGVDYLKKAERVEITEEKLREKHQSECDSLVAAYRRAVESNPSSAVNLTEFHKLRQFIVFSIIDKAKQF